MKKPYKPIPGVKVAGHEVPVQRKSWGGRSQHGKLWFGMPPVAATAYDSKLRMVSRGDFSEAEIRAMERLYGGRIRRPKKAKVAA